ncbi:MAG: zinc-binding dehydrogenase, partial [Candidatus Heimdallarchaeota archaeon]|nr:zinc-binding dehydrogenase [Candidatus Heimdallarchaeota archaeon]
ECVGSNQTIDDAIENARKGTDIIIAGVYSDKPVIDLATVQDRELRLIGMLMYQTKEYLKAIELVHSGKVQLEPLMTKHFKFEDYDKAYQYIEEKKDKVMKIFIDVN